MREEIETFVKETGVLVADLCRYSRIDQATVHRILHKGAQPRTEAAIKLREAMTYYRAEIKARLEKAAEEGRASGAGA